jgi:hypothetical protein
MFTAIQRFFKRTRADDYIPFATDLPRPMTPDPRTIYDTIELGAVSGAAGTIVNGPADGLARGAITAMGHRVALSSAWDEYYEICAEAAEQHQRPIG